MTTAVLSLGSNMGDSRAHLEHAVAALRPDVTAVSSLYRTPPWGPVPQDDFLNIVVIVSNPATDARGWWDKAQRLERAAHRERVIRWGPRTLDVDVIAVWGRAACGDAGSAHDPAPHDHDVARGLDTVPITSDDPALTLPHPRAAERGFVLVPWAELQPDAVLPGHGRIADLLAALDVSDIERVAGLGA